MDQPLDSVYAACPKCGHAPLPAEPAFPAGWLRLARGIGMAAAWSGKAMMLAGLAWAAWMVWAARMVWLQPVRLRDAVFAKIDHE